MGQSVKQSNVKVWFRSGLLVVVPLALLLLRPPVASTQEPADTPPPAGCGQGKAARQRHWSERDRPLGHARQGQRAGHQSTRGAHRRETRRRAAVQGALTCSSSLCHGGGSAERNAYTIWNRSDPHQHAVATLNGIRSTAIARGAQLANAPASTRCTVCHAPLAGVPDERLPAALDVLKEGVSCESCHGAAQNWMRSHTRRDFTHAQNVQTGVRELRNLYNRANACVSCHQVIDSDLLTAGHPPLLFELDAQTVAEPRHWTNDTGDFFGPQAWLTGQAVALREMSWSLSQNSSPVAEEREQWRALVWLLQRTVDARGKDGGLPGFDAVPNPDDFNAGNVARAQTTADDFARSASHLEWSSSTVRRCLDELTATDKEFAPVAGGEGEMALRPACATARAGVVAPDGSPAKNGGCQVEAGLDGTR